MHPAIPVVENTGAVVQEMTHPNRTRLGPCAMWFAPKPPPPGPEHGGPRRQACLIFRLDQFSQIREGTPHVANHLPSSQVVTITANNSMRASKTVQQALNLRADFP
jgi:hypothetical protein